MPRAKHWQGQILVEKEACHRSSKSLGFWAGSLLTESFSSRLPGISPKTRHRLCKSIVEPPFACHLQLLFLCTTLNSLQSFKTPKRQRSMSLSRYILGLACLWHGVIASPPGAVPSNIPIATDLQTPASVAQPIANSRKLHGKFLHITGEYKRDWSYRLQLTRAKLI